MMTYEVKAPLSRRFYSCGNSGRGAARARGAGVNTNKEAELFKNGTSWYLARDKAHFRRLSPSPSSVGGIISAVRRGQPDVVSLSRL